MVFFFFNGSAEKPLVIRAMFRKDDETYVEKFWRVEERLEGEAH